MGLFTITKGWIAFTVLHFVLFALALTTIGLYAVDLDNARIQRKYADSKWVSQDMSTLPSGDQRSQESSADCNIWNNRAMVWLWAPCLP